MKPVRTFATALLLLALSGCASDAQPSPTERPFPNSVMPGATRGPGGDLDCSRLLSTEEIAGSVGVDVQPRGSHKISCFWATPTRRIQLVLQTGPDAGRWFEGLQEPGESAGMVPVAGYDFDAITRPGSFGGFVPGRAALLHGVDDQNAAATLVRLVLTRL
jgi:hypothetical protein